MEDDGNVAAITGTALCPGMINMSEEEILVCTVDKIEGILRRSGYPIGPADGDETCSWISDTIGTDTIMTNASMEDASFGDDNDSTARVADALLAYETLKETKSLVSCHSEGSTSSKRSRLSAFSNKVKSIVSRSSRKSKQGSVVQDAFELHSISESETGHGGEITEVAHNLSPNHDEVASRAETEMLEKEGLSFAPAFPPCLEEDSLDDDEEENLVKDQVVVSTDNEEEVEMHMEKCDEKPGDASVHSKKSTISENKGGVSHKSTENKSTTEEKVEEKEDIAELQSVKTEAGKEEEEITGKDVETTEEKEVTVSTGLVENDAAHTATDEKEAVVEGRLLARRQWNPDVPLPKHAEELTANLLLEIQLLEVMYLAKRV